LLLIIYALFCLGLFLYWLIWKSEKNNIHINNPKHISVLIPVRNESENIVDLLTDLEKQSLNKYYFEVLVIDDSSTDSTVKLVEDFILHSDLNLKLISLPEDHSIRSPKKRAIRTAIKLAAGEIIVTTDGDCRVGKDWLVTYSAFFERKEAVFVSAPVLFLESKRKGFFHSLWAKIQQIEFASLIVSGAVSMKAGFPNMCSGANIGYLKTAFFEVDGFEGNDHLASGDDEFLMHKMVKAFPGKVNYLKSEAAVVKTFPLPDLKSFYNQRKRWAGKWYDYQMDSPKWVAGFIFFTNLSCIYVGLTGNYELLLIKLLPEFLFLSLAIAMYKNMILLIIIPFVQLIYPFYVVFFGFTSLLKRNYNWKNRELN
jgi:cellulose synthase/poly-beta-1,6-N-acetylglucosamine synthase-like glycosyltransferase